MPNIKKNYRHYQSLQKGKFSSLESTDSHWSAGQRRFIDITFSDLDKNLSIMDLSCGDGVGLKEFKRLGFNNVTGVEFNDIKINLAKKVGYPVIKSDLHDLKEIKSQYDIIYSSHTLEHALYPKKALREIYTHLKPTGILIVVLPYPDVKIESKDAHVARRSMSLDIYDDAKSIITYFRQNNFNLIDKFFDSFREPEVWLVFSRKGSKTTIKYHKYLEKLNYPNLTVSFYLSYLYDQRKSLLSNFKSKIRNILSRS